MSLALLPHERAALTVAWAQVQRGEFPMPGCATVCVAALARLDAESHSGRPRPGENSACLPADDRGFAEARSSEGGNGRAECPAVSIQSREPVGSDTASDGAGELEAKDKATSVDPAPVEIVRTVWTKNSNSDPYCVHCGKTWDMHLADGHSSCPRPR